MLTKTCWAMTLVVVGLVCGSCSTPARQEEMAAADFVGDKTYDASLAIVVYGEVGGFASHYYQLPRENVERALFQTLERSGVFRSVAMGGDADYKLSVGLIQLVQPQWSGMVTLETTWALTSTISGTELARQSIRTTSPSSFADKREATEDATRKNIVEGINWMLSIIDEARTNDVGDQLTPNIVRNASTGTGADDSNAIHVSARDAFLRRLEKRLTNVTLE